MRSPYPPPPGYAFNPGQYPPPPGYVASPGQYAAPPPPGSQGYNSQRRASFNPPPENYREAPPSPKALQRKSTERREKAKKELTKAQLADKRFKDKATKGFLGAGAVAGLWEILEGLSAI